MKLCQSKQADLLFLASLLPPYLKAPCRNPCSMFKRSNILISIMLYECLKKSKTLDQKWTKHHFSQLLALADVWSIGMSEPMKITNFLGLNDPASGLDDKRLNSVQTVLYQSRPIWLPKILWIQDFRTQANHVTLSSLNNILTHFHQPFTFYSVKSKAK